MRRGHLFIEGKVQNVGFRHFTKLNAEEVGVHGWVKNLPDGRVEVIFEGPEDHIDEIVARSKTVREQAGLMKLILSGKSLPVSSTHLK